METKLNLITNIAGKEVKCRFNNLIYLLNVENLRDSFYKLKKDRASGIDGQSFEDYEKDLERNLEGLVDRMKRQAYKPQAVRRAYIPKANGQKRPLGIPTVEDKMVQMGIARILNAIYEADFVETSYGFRPGRSCHDALNTLDKIIMTKPVNHIIDADIKGFFDNVNHDWMMKCLEQRIRDKNLLRLIKRFLIGGYMEDGQYYATEQGTPQGGVISPILANIYLHYVIDLWMTKVIKKQCQGYVEMVRYADDFIICVQKKEEAKKILEWLKVRLAKFGLELAGEKTRVIEFGRYAEENAQKRGEKPGTFDFLGMTHYVDKTRKGWFKVGRKTDRKKIRGKVKEINGWLKQIRNMLSVTEWWKILQAKLRGHYQYYGISGNYTGVRCFYEAVKRLLYKWLNRRSQKKSFNWKTFSEYITRHKLPKPKICYNLYAFSGYGSE